MTSKRPNSAAVVAETDDLVIEILARLPVKPLLKFKCVSKRWLSLISNPQLSFSHSQFHRRLKPSPIAILINDSYYSTPDFRIIPLDPSATQKVELSLDFLNFPRISILQSCNGLLLLSSSFLVSPSEIFLPDYGRLVHRSSTVVTEDDRGIAYLLCNPTTRQFKKLSFPSPLKEKMRIPYPLLNYQHRVVFVCFAFDPKRSPYYKIIVMIKLNKSLVEIYIYSSETDTWTSLTTDVTDLCMDIELSPIGFHNGFYCNGAIHWYRKVGNPSAVYFDLDNEIFKKMALPPELDVWYFGESDGHLYVIGGHGDLFLPLDYVVWEMAADYSEWFVRYHINLQSMREESSELSWKVCEVLSITCAKDEKKSVVVVLVDGVVMSYKVSDGTSKRIFDLEWKSLFGACTQDHTNPYQYVETIHCF